MIYRATHITQYSYEGPVAQCVSEARLKPRTFAGQKLHEWHMTVDPEPVRIEQRRDYFGNDVTAYTVMRPHDRFTTTSTSIVEVLPRAESETESGSALPKTAWNEVRDRLIAHPSDDELAAYEFAFDSPFVAAHPALLEYGRATFTPDRPLAEAAHELSHRIHTEFKYQPKSTSIDMPLIQVLKQRQGVCQDFAHIMIGVLRSWGLAARYVSGYLRAGANFQGAQASHAWVAVYIPEYGWLPFDPTNDVIPAEGHVTVAWGRDYADVTPVKGVALGGGRQTVEVEVHVEPQQDESGVN